MTPTDLKEAAPKEETKISAKTVNKKLAASRVRISRKAKNGMFDVPEIVAVAVAGVTLLVTLFAYFLMLLPAREEFKKREAERSQKQTQLLDLQTKAQEAGTNAAGTVDLASSVDRFETNFLPLPANGNAALYQRLNELIRINGLRNTAGPEYAPLESVDPSRAAKTEDRRQTGKQPGIFPGTYVTVTVEGNYASLRHFVNDLEGTRQFLVINAVEIESNGSGDGGGSSNAPTNNLPPATAVAPGLPAGMPNGFPNAAQPKSINPRAAGGGNPAAIAPPAAAAGQTQAKRGTVSLQLEMAAYFRRPMTIQN